MTHTLVRLVLLVAVVSLTPCLKAQRERFTPDEIDQIEKKWPGTKKTSTGIRYLVLKPGDGPVPKDGQRVGVAYVGYLLDGKKFDEHPDPDHPLIFRVGREEVIQGWDQLLTQMKLHEKRLAIIPGSLAYGSRGRSPTIPRDATLVFEMELVAIDPPAS